jgi:hypothetical protein
MSDALDDAACRGRAEVMEGRTMQDRAEAVQVCASCPLLTREACQSLADTLYRLNGSIVGVWNSTFYESLDVLEEGQPSRHKPRRLSVPVSGVPHGGGGGRKAGCRCEPCLDWERNRSKIRAEQRKSA